MKYKTRRKPNKQTRKINLNLPIDVIHDIQEDCGAIFWIHNNIVHRDMPILIQQVMLINMPPPSCETMVPLPHVEHFAKEVSKVRAILEHSVEIYIGLLPQ